MVDAIAGGARWLWAPSQDEQGRVAWDLPLPDWWPELRSHLLQTRTSLALATAHSNRAGRHAFAEAASVAAHLHCTVTHAVRLSSAELTELAEMGCTFELDLYTSVFQIGGSTWSSLADRSLELCERDYGAYITSDAGQQHVGNPFAFSSSALRDLEDRIGHDVVDRLADKGPASFCSRILAGPDAVI